MSSTTSPPIPPIETTPHPDIVAAKTPLDVVNAVLANPVLEDTVDKYTGATTHTPGVALLASVVIDLATQYGLHLTSNESLLAAIVVGGVTGYGYQWISKKMAPVTPVTGGTTP